VAQRFIEEETPKTQEEWDWQKEHNPDFWAGWTETKEILDWWYNKYDDCYPFNLSKEEREMLEKETGKSSYELSREYEVLVLKKASRLIELSPVYWT
jgi:hypothetical protein